MTDATAAVIDTRETNAFGLSVTSAGTPPTPFRFAGQHGYQTDGNTGLMRFGHRYYDASVGRFISRDPIQDGYNWYAYCNNDPVNDDDPEGLQDDLVTEAAGAAFLAWLLWWMWYQQHNNTPPIVWPSLPRNPPSEARRPRNGRRVTEGHGDDKPGHTPQSGDQAKGQQGFHRKPGGGSHVGPGGQPTAQPPTRQPGAPHENKYNKPVEEPGDWEDIDG